MTLVLPLLIVVAGLPSVSFAQAKKPFAIPSERAGASGPVDILVARTTFADSDDPSVSRHSEEDLREMLSGLDAFLEWQSYGSVDLGKIEFAETVELRKCEEYGIVEDERTGKTKRKRNIAGDALAALRESRDVDPLEEFDSVFFLIEKKSEGVRLSSGAAAVSVLDGRGVTFFGKRPGWRIAAHEFGHNMGHAHARSILDLSGTSVVPSLENARYVTYGDPFSPMGHGKHSYNLVEKVRKGWIALDGDAPRHVAEAVKGIHRVTAYDRPDATGVLGLFADLRLGLRMLDEKKRRRRGQVVEIPDDLGTQRAWISILSSEPFDGEAPGFAAEPRLLIHVSGIEGPERRLGIHGLLDTTPGPGELAADVGGRERRERIADTGLRVGQRVALRLESGQDFVVGFEEFDRKSGVARVRITR
ncbi:MAG: hypothetical protein AAF726_06630 [Planctomycetota bacterium]